MASVGFGRVLVSVLFCFVLFLFGCRVGLVKKFVRFHQHRHLHRHVDRDSYHDDRVRQPISLLQERSHVASD